MKADSSLTVLGPRMQTKVFKSTGVTGRNVNGASLEKGLTTLGLDFTIKPHDVREG